MRACPDGKGLAIKDSGGDPFPGTGNVTVVGPFTEPGLTGWNDINTVGIQLEEIAEDEQGVITFRSTSALGGKDVEDFEDMTTSGTSSKNVQGKYCQWSFTKGGVYSPGADLCRGTRAAGLLKGGTLETSAVDNVETVSMRLFNSAARTSNIRLQYYDESVGGWVILKDRNGQAGTTLEASSAVTLRFDIAESIRPGLRLQLKVVTGSDSERLYIDDVQMRGVYIGVGGVMDDAPETLRAYVDADGTLAVFTSGRRVSVYDVAGRLAASGDVAEGSSRLRLPARGIYIVTDGHSVAKVAY